MSKITRAIWLGTTLATVVFSLILLHFIVGDSPPKATNWVARLPSHILSGTDDFRGNIWIGSEGQGIWRCEIVTGSWTQCTSRDGLGDDFGYGLACDRKGRIWAGHLNHGVSVFDGAKWQNYEMIRELSQPSSLAGPLGERVFDIAVCPTDGDVWIATNVGLTRYSEINDVWTYITKADGLPDDRVQAIATDARGDIYLATQCSGIEIARAEEGYKKWQVVSAPESPPKTPFGSGLPSGLCNDILVAKEGTIYVATTAGIAWSKDRGNSWQYVRGMDFFDKTPGLENRQAQIDAAQGNLLAEDYVTCLAEHPDGRFYVGYRKMGCAQITPDTWRPKGALGAAGAFVTSIVPIQSKETEEDPNDPTGMARRVKQVDPFIGTYGNQHNIPQLPEKRVLNRTSSTDTPEIAKLPSSAVPPSFERLAQTLADMIATESSAKASSAYPQVVEMADDWRTQGDWLGRYGRYSAILCAMCGRQDYIWGAGQYPIEYLPELGPRHEKGDSNRYWVGNLYTTDRRILEIPPVYMDSRVIKGMTTREKNRRDSQWDDHGEVYPASLNGPDLYFNMRLPPGYFLLSIYEVNADGHAGKNRARDFRLSVRANSNDVLSDIGGWEFRTELANARVRDFWGGVYKGFAVKGPGKITVKVERNHSLNANITAVFLDEYDETPMPYFDPALVKSISQRKIVGPTDERLDAIRSLFDRYTTKIRSNPLQLATDRGGPYCLVLRWLDEEIRQGRLLAEQCALMRAKCYYALHCFEPFEKAQKQLGLTTAREIEKALQWDRKTNEDSSSGRYVVTDYVTKHPTSLPANHN